MQCFGIAASNGAQRCLANGIKSKWKCGMSTSKESMSFAAYVWGIIAVVAFFVWATVRDDGPNASIGDHLYDGALDILNAILRGKRATNAPYDKTTGVVPASPAALAAVAGVDLEVYSLARMISSEEGRSSNAVKGAVAWAVVNHASASGKSITDLLTAAKNGAHSGYYGTQKDIDPASPNKGGSDRYASTANDPYTGDLEIAAGVLGGTIEDISGGADQFDRPSGESNPDRVATNREAGGSVLADTTFLDDPDIRFWKKL